MLTAQAEKNSVSRTGFPLVVWAAFAAFSTYFCMYGFRKPLTATTFDGVFALGISFKSALVIAQVLGYMCAKFIGIKFIAELNNAKRAFYILSLIGGAHASLLLFALVPQPYCILFLFTNGLCLGLIWGLVFSFIEGRKYTDILALVLSVNFIFSSGIAKSLGRACIVYWRVPELFVPFVSGLFYIPLLLLSVWMLTKIPPPTAEESASRGKRVALGGKERITVFLRFFTGLIAITFINLLLTILRDLRDNYGVEILRTLKPSFRPLIFSQMETAASVTVLGLLLLLTVFKKHFTSIAAHHAAIFAGFLVLLACTWLLKLRVFEPVLVLTAYTIGLYICYNTLQCLFLDRFISCFKVEGNTGFFFYFMDAIGYLGSCVVIIGKELFQQKAGWLAYFLQISTWFGLAGILCIAVSWWYFNRKYRQSINLP